ncbi:TonB-dependent receptor [Govanella unica]|uniref:TonB-dependent receptor n=1 Tax=Govanella unica TaxID=2975056 RepID=A0A9X3TW53_9PROT|nr:TonB-dependent receptor [Govania unica]MDA5192836.1 TonB-dependent receptor [Govania unica]
MINALSSSSSSRHLKRILLASALSAVTLPAMAQSSGAIEEIIVTALKRSTNLQETPIAISAVSGAALASMGATGISDYVKAVPGLSLVDGGAGQRRLVIRGVQGVGEAQTGLYYDETPVTGSPGTSNDAGARQPDMFLFDVERIEVLRGPQGTLYGAGSMSGTVRVLFNKPNMTEYEGAVDGTVSNTEHGGMGYKINGMVNAPLVEGKLAARAVLYYNNQDGYVDSNILGSNINDEKTWGGRFLLRAKPAENLTLDASVHIQRTDAYVGGWDGNNPRPYQSAYAIDMSTKDNSEIYNLTANWDIGFANITAVTSYYNRETKVPVDVTTFMKNIGQPMYTPSVLFYDPQNVNNWTNELRMSSLGEGALHWTFGGYLEKRKAYIVSAQYMSDPISGERIFPYNILTSRYIEDSLKQKALFGEVSYDFLPELTFTAGTRYFNYNKDIVGSTTIGFAPIGAIKTPAAEAHSKENGWVFKFNLSYKPTDHVMFYAQAAQGFRPGGANQVIGLAESLTPYDSDSLWNYEAGVKSSWLDNRLVANITGYWIDWKDMQVQGRTANNAFSFVSNAGAARIKGVEFEFIARPLDGWQIGLTGDYRDAKLTKAQVNPNLNANLLSLGRKGDRIPYVAKFSATLMTQYTHDVGNNMNLMVRGDVSYVGSSYSEYQPTYVYYTRSPSYTLVGARTGLEGSDGDWGVYVFVNNLFDKEAIVRRTSSAFGSNINFSAPPRTFGLNAKKNF